MGSQDTQEKTEEATPRKLREARKKGQVPKSRDLNSVLLLILVFFILGFLKSTLGRQLKDFMVRTFERINESSWQPASNMHPVGENALVLFPMLEDAFYTILKVSAPFLIIVFVVSALVSYLQVGGIFSIEPIKPTLKKINPIEGFKNLFKMRNFVELIKSALKIILIFLIAYFSIKTHLDDLIMTVTTGIVPTLVVAGKILTSFVIKVGVFFLAIALFDLTYQRWQFAKDMRMSKYEIMQEYKRDEGDPHIKGRRREIHQELLNTDMSKVAKSDVVVVNPVHLAIAMKYDRTYMQAPQVMVKGQRLVAQQIKDLAQKYHVPIVENVPLAHTLIELDAGDEIPEEIYQAMAEILNFVYRLKSKPN